jgi:hypothetical protein
MKEKITTITFVSFIFFMMLINILSPSQSLSYSERRPLETLPKWSFDDYISGEYMASFQKYIRDQFVKRDDFRSLKHYFSVYGFGLKDLNGIYYGENHIFKIENPDMDSVENFLDYIKSLESLFTEGQKMYLSIIPDKSYYYDDHPYKPNYDVLYESFNKALNEIKIIDIFEGLSLKSYYQTDPHWRQENLFSVMNIISNEMDFSQYGEGSFEMIDLDGFKGAYYGQGPLYNQSESLIYLHHSDFKNLIITNFQNREKDSLLYDLEGFETIDPYNLFLDGPSPLITIENPDSQSNEELIIFRDSFASSIAPYFFNHYKKVILIDTRYMEKDQIQNYIDIKDQDVLFLYSSLLIYNSYSLK